MPDFGALAYLNQANTFTEPITVKKDADPLLTLYRDSISTGNIRFNLDAQDSNGDQSTYSRFFSDIQVNTAGLEEAYLVFQTINGGSLNTVLSVAPDGSLEFGSGGLATMNDIGLSTTRFFKFPDCDGRVHVVERHYFEQQDDFTCGSISNTNTSNQIGILNWGTSSAGTSAPLVTAGVTSHPGIASLITGATSGNNNRIHLTDAAATAWCDPTDIERFAWVLRVPTITTMSVRIGIGQDLSSTTFGTAGAWFSFDSAVDTHWQTITRQASTSTTNTSTITVTAGNWYLLEAIRVGSDWLFYINDSLKFTHSANQPTTNCNVGAMVQTATTAARNLDIDYFHIRTKKLGQRWT